MTENRDSDCIELLKRVYNDVQERVLAITNNYYDETRYVYGSRCHGKATIESFGDREYWKCHDAVYYIGPKY